MKLLIDECLAKSTVLILKKARFEVLRVEKVLKPGVENNKVFDYAAKREIPIITHDRGFGILYHFSQIKPPTIIILQVLSPHPEETNKLLNKFLSQFDLNQPKISGKLILISRSTVRIRSK